MKRKPFNPLVGTTAMVRSFKEIFSREFTQEEIAGLAETYFNGRTLDDMLQLKPETPLGDFLLILTALNSKVRQEVNLTWVAPTAMSIRYGTENTPQSEISLALEDAKASFIKSLGGREPTDAELADFDHAGLADEPEWMRSIPLSTN